MGEDVGATLVTTSRVKIRRFTTSDTQAFIGFMTDADSTLFLEFEDYQKTAAGADALIKATIDSYRTKQPLMAFAVERLSNGEFVGFCGLTPRDQQSVEVMYAVVPTATGKGLATEIAKALSNYALNQLGYTRVIAPIRADHAASVAVAKKAGFRLQGRDGDREIYQFSQKET